MYTYKLIHSAEQQKLAQQCKTIILQFLKREEDKLSSSDHNQKLNGKLTNAVREVLWIYVRAGQKWKVF